MNEPGSIWFWGILFIISVSIIVSILIRPCYTPRFIQRAHQGGSEMSHAVSGGERAFAPVVNDVGGSHGITLQEDENGISSVEWYRSTLHQYRSYVIFTLCQAVFLFLLIIAIGMNSWSNATFGRAEVVLGLTSRTVNGVPVDEVDDIRWSEGLYNKICESSGTILGCAFTIQATGALVLGHALVGMISMAIVLAYLVLSRYLILLKSFAVWIWRLILIQAVASVSAALIWVMVGHTFIVSHAPLATVDISFFMVLFVGVGSSLLSYCLRITLLMLDADSSNQWRTMALLENEIHAPIEEDRHQQSESDDEEEEDGHHSNESAPVGDDGEQLNGYRINGSTAHTPVAVLPPNNMGEQP